HVLAGGNFGENRSDAMHGSQLEPLQSRQRLELDQSIGGDRRVFYLKRLEVRQIGNEGEPPIGYRAFIQIQGLQRGEAAHVYHQIVAQLGVASEAAFYVSHSHVQLRQIVGSKTNEKIRMS